MFVFVNVGVTPGAWIRSRPGGREGARLRRIVWPGAKSEKMRRVLLEGVSFGPRMREGVLAGGIPPSPQVEEDFS